MDNVHHLPENDEAAALEDIRQGNLKLRIQFGLFVGLMLLLGIGGTLVLMRLADSVTQ